MSHPLPRVAIVDDDTAVLESTRFLLEITGHRTETFSSPGDFLAESERQAFDRLIIDQHMPLLTGLEVVHRLRTRGLNIPTMLITGALTPEIVARAGRMRLEKVVEKPASEADLMDFIGGSV